MKPNTEHLMVCICLLIMSLSFKTHAQGIAPEELKSPAYGKELIAAKWKAGNTEYAFDINGTSIVTTSDRQCPGTWVLSNKTLTISPKKLMWKKADPCSKTMVLEIKNISAEAMDITDMQTNKELHLTKLK